MNVINFIINESFCIKEAYVLAATLTIEQMILNHNIGVNLSDAGTLDGHPIEDFSLKGHKHSADDITSGIMAPARLPKGTTTAAGIVSLTNSLDSNSQQIAPTAYALSSVYRAVAGKSNLGHTHTPGEINAGQFPGRMSVASNTAYTTKQLRNIILSPNPPKATDGEDGDVWLQYEP
jgi:hypothetical protein